MMLAGKNILLTNIWLKNYAGSELNCLDISIALRNMGANVEIATFEYDYPIRAEYEKNHLNVKVAHKEELERKHYDLIWAHHTVVLDYLLFEKGITADRVIFSCLSSFEPYEVVPAYGNDLSLCLAVSSETQGQMLCEGIAREKVLIFPNYTTEAMFDKGGEHTQNSCLKKVAVVSNHVPAEVRAAGAILAKNGIQTDFYGIEDRFVMVNAELLLQYDAIITIGKTVRYGMALSIPVFVYDHFGGYGYLSSENFNTAQYYNLSGRGGEKKSAETIAAELQQGYASACKETDYLRRHICNNCILEKNIEKVLQIVDKKQPVDIEGICKNCAVKGRENKAFIRLFMTENMLEKQYAEQSTLLKAQLAQQCAVLAQQRSQLTERDSVIAQQRSQIAERDNLLAQQQSQIAQQSNVMAQQSAALAQQQSQIAYLQWQYDDLTHAFFWKITYPLRKTTDLLKRLFGKSRLARSLWRGLKRLKKNIFHRTEAPAEQAARDLPAVESAEEMLPRLALKGSVFAPEAYRPPLALSLDAPIDIIVPVYNGYDIIGPLLDSIPRTELPYRLILVDDKSPDLRVKRMLRQYEAEHDNVIVVENEENLGYTCSVNRGLRMSEGHVVLLNTDVRLPMYWLERVIAPILADDSVATATPFTNSGTICSFPNFCENNDLYLGLSVDEIDAAFSRLQPQYTEIPTGVGFCMALSRHALDAIGLYDEENFARGYGEENDWCQRAVAHGLRNVMVENLFVYHQHGATFLPEEKKRLSEDHLGIVNRRYPNYAPDVQRYCEEDPVKPYRDAAKFLLFDRGASNGTIVAFDHA